MHESERTSELCCAVTLAEQEDIIQYQLENLRRLFILLLSRGECVGIKKFSSTELGSVLGVCELINSRHSKREEAKALPGTLLCIGSPDRFTWKRKAVFSPSCIHTAPHHVINSTRETSIEEQCSVLFFFPWLIYLPISQNGYPQNLSNPFSLFAYLCPPQLPYLTSSSIEKLKVIPHFM